MKTLLLLVGLLLTWENGRVLGDQMVSDAELQGKWSRGSPPRTLPLCQGLKLCSGCPSRSLLSSATCFRFLVVRCAFRHLSVSPQHLLAVASLFTSLLVPGPTPPPGSLAHLSLCEFPFLSLHSPYYMYPPPFHLQNQCSVSRRGEMSSCKAQLQGPLLCQAFPETPLPSSPHCPAS